MKIRLRLAEALQTTLDPEELLNIFYAEIQQLLPIDGLSYHHDIADVNIHVADHAEHLFSYNLVTSKELLGELKISRSTPFLAKELDFLNSHLDVIVYPLRNALNYRDAVNASMRDPLTGAGNRIALTNALHHEIEITKRYNQPMAVLMLDMDNFKYINDMFGHSQGDDVLISVVETMIEDVRTSDAVFRYGGEEFVILLNNTTLERATFIAERLRSKIEALTLEEDGLRIITTSSIGIAMMEPDETISRLLMRADKAMYQAKESGRNQVRVAT
ncbi:MAG: GGDEF domain-containing protein [Gammaproteobacteria bacterium]|nr:GGDEF domain-containing protein [Gammaproteobacteria bacterium]